MMIKMIGLKGLTGGNKSNRKGGKKQRQQTVRVMTRIKRKGIRKR